MKLSLRNKVILFMVFMMAVIGAAGGVFNRTFVTRVITGEYYERAGKIASTVSYIVDPLEVKAVRDEALKTYEAVDKKVLSDEWGSPAFDEYISNYKYIEDMPEYGSILTRLQDIQKGSQAKGVYIAYVEPGREIAMYLVDGSQDDPCPAGCLDQYEEGFVDSANMKDEGVAPYETHGEPYGWLVTCAEPIKYEGETIAYACVDLSMNEIEGVINRYNSAGVLAIVVCLLSVSVIGVVLVNEFAIKPIKKLTEVASQYRIVKDEIGGLESSAFRELDIKTGDEIEVLAQAMKKMESDLNDQIENLFATRQELVATREHADIMSEMANRDALTGIRNKRGYETEIQRINKSIAMGNTKVGVVMVDMNDLKEVNDRYGHEKGDKVICSMCDMLCSVFKRSPVFRIGGDEFVVVVSNYDYANLESNVDKFLACVNHNIEESELEPWERASAAIGYAVFEEDKDVAIEDTLKRADEKMYECKQEMKERLKKIKDKEAEQEA